MSSNRCTGCGFLNFATDSVCKRCRAQLQALSDNPYFNSYVAGTHGGYQPATGYGPQAYSSGYFPAPLAPLPPVSKNGGVNAALMALVGLALAVAAGVGVFWKMGNGSARFAWQEYDSKDGSYSIMMPGKPAHQTERQPSMAGELQVHLMMADMSHRGAFMVGHTDYPAEFAEVNAEEMLDLAAQGAVNSSEATLLGKKEIALDGHPGVELELAVKQIKGGRTVTRIYWVAPRRIYIMFASIPTSAETDIHLAKFFDSLKLRRH